METIKQISFVVRMMLWEGLPQQGQQEELREGPGAPAHPPQFWEAPAAPGTLSLQEELPLATERQELLGPLWRQPEEEVSCQEWWHPWEELELELWSSARWGWRRAKQGLRNISHVSHLLWLLVPMNLSNVLVNQNVDQNRGFSGALKISSKVWLFAMGAKEVRLTLCSEMAP